MAELEKLYPPEADSVGIGRWHTQSPAQMVEESQSEGTATQSQDTTAEEDSAFLGGRIPRRTGQTTRLLQERRATTSCATTPRKAGETDADSD